LSLTYRPDIDGLRAIAVMAVVLFHSGLSGFSGGFVGVDVFFVISGFLITSIIIKDLDAGCFSFAHFYERRIRRILPAYFCMIAGTFTLSWFILLPLDFKDFALSGLSSVFYVSNYYFWTDTGYFGGMAAEKPLVHTWSLGVEEQFYILYPLFLFLLYKFVGRSVLFWALFFCAVLSLVASEYVAGKDQFMSFYFLPTRAWELAIGGLLAFGLIKPVSSQGLASLLALVGAGLIAASIVFYDKATLFPGLSALAPCVGAALLIYAGSSGSLVSRTLSLPPFVFIGKISYSLYLWHWPLIALWNYRFAHQVEPAHMAGILALSFVLAFLSWRFIENPVRRPELLTRVKIFTYAGLVSAVISGFFLVSILAQGLPQRFDERVYTYQMASQDFSPLRQICNNAPLKNGEAGLKECMIGDLEQKTVSAFIWGDSIADSVSPVVSDVLETHNLKGVQATKNACAPLLGTHLTRLPEFLTVQCKAYNEKVLAYLKNHDDIRYVFLIGEWPDVMEFISYGAYQKDKVPAMRKSDYETAMRATVKAVQDAGKNPVLIGSLPRFPYNVPKCLARQSAFKDMRHYPCAVLPTETFYIASAQADAVLEGLEGVSVYLPRDVLCDEQACYPEKEDVVIYYDNSHLSVSGSKVLYDGVNAAFLRVFRTGEGT